jgi:hypothetical protein
MTDRSEVVGWNAKSRHATGQRSPTQTNPKIRRQANPETTPLPLPLVLLLLLLLLLLLVLLLVLLLLLVLILIPVFLNPKKDDGTTNLDEWAGMIGRLQERSSSTAG